MLKKDKYIYIRLTPEQIDVLKSKSSRNHMTMSSYIWHLVLMDETREINISSRGDTHGI